MKSQGLVAAHTRKMLPVENAMNRMIANANFDFASLTESQQEQHDAWAREWDLLKADRDMAHLVDQGHMTLDEFNAKKLA